MQVEHLSSERLAAFMESKNLVSEEHQHLNECWECVRAMIDLIQIESKATPEVQ